MKKKTDYSIGKFEEACSRLREGTQMAKDELGKDGVIQRFEFTFELLWKTLKVYLETEKGIQSQSPRDALKNGFSAGIIKDETICLQMLEDRNKTAHLYDKAESEKIYQNIKTKYLDFFADILETLKSK